ncbi:MAG: hypothetical protein M1820_004534 [Bogoriella megaspora]|nr:MAG: hypothetical protein M1820_004534 [Bogoriella megaspora]
MADVGMYSAVANDNTSSPGDTSTGSYVSGNNTFLLNSVYLSIEEVYARDDCSNPVGSTYSGSILTLASDQVYSIRSSSTSGSLLSYSLPFNYADLNTPIPWSAWLGMPQFATDTEACNTIVDSSYFPQLVVPPQIQSLDPLWGCCVLNLKGLFDPPWRLTAEATAAAPTPEPTSAAPASNPSDSLATRTPVSAPSPPPEAPVLSFPDPEGRPTHDPHTAGTAISQPPSETGLGDPELPPTIEASSAQTTTSSLFRTSADPIAYTDPSPAGTVAAGSISTSVPATGQDLSGLASPDSPTNEVISGLSSAGIFSSASAPNDHDFGDASETSNSNSASRAGNEPQEDDSNEGGPGGDDSLRGNPGQTLNEGTGANAGTEFSDTRAIAIGASPTTIEGTPISVGPDHIVIGTSTIKIPQRSPGITESAAIATVGSYILVEDPSHSNSIFVLNGQYPDPSNPSSQGDTSNAFEDPGNPVQIMTIEGQTFTADSASNYEIASGVTLSPGGFATLSGTQISMFSDGGSMLVGSGTSAQILPVSLATKIEDILTIGQMTATLDAQGNYEFTSSLTLTPGGIVTISGTPVSLAGDGEFAMVGSSTETLKSAMSSTMSPLRNQTDSTLGSSPSNVITSIASVQATSGVAKCEWSIGLSIAFAGLIALVL